MWMQTGETLDYSQQAGVDPNLNNKPEISRNPLTASPFPRINCCLVDTLRR